MARVLADEHIKLTVLTTKPADVTAPTATELNAGIDASCLVFADDYTWTATDSERIGERAICEGSASESPGIGNYDLGITAWRWFDPETGEIDAEADELFAALKEKGTSVWAYERRTGKEHSEDWAAGDEIHLGGEVTTDTPQVTENTGFIKYRIPLMSGRMVDFGEVATGA